MVQFTIVWPAGGLTPSVGEVDSGEKLRLSSSRAAECCHREVSRRSSALCRQPRPGRLLHATATTTAGEENKEAAFPLCCLCERWTSNKSSTPGPKCSNIQTVAMRNLWFGPERLHRKQFTLMIHLVAETIQRLVHTLDVSVRTTVSHVELVPLP